jgi:hypothetical protein
MPNYDPRASGQVLQYCRGLYNPVGTLLSVEQIRIQNTNRAAIDAEVQKCASNFDAAEVTAHRRIAMRYCLGHNDYTVPGPGDRLKAYDECMYQNDTLTALCSQELRYRAELNHMRNLADQKCPVPRPNGRETLVIKNGGHDDIGHPVVIPATGPGLPAIVQSPMAPGMIQRAGASAANPPPIAAPTQAAPQRVARPASASPSASPISTPPVSNRPAAVKAAPSTTPADVDAIIELVKGGMSEPLVIKTIQRQGKVYDLTPAEVLKLQKAGVSEKVIDALLDREAAPAATPAPAIAAPQQRQQQAAERQKQNQERAQRYTACRQQAIKDHPEGGGELAKAVTSCVQILRAK